MNYDISFYSQERARKRYVYYRNKPIFSKKGIDTNKVFFDFILREIEKDNNKKNKILDLGTGTGYVPEVLCQLSSKIFDITGVDLSEKMLNIAIKKNDDSRISFLLSDNDNLPFKNSVFDIVTNKLTTQFSTREVYRVLKGGGIFIFKEYGENKGFEEIKLLFKNRYKKTKKTSLEYIKELQILGFNHISLNLFQIVREYSLLELKDIFSMANLISNFSDEDMAIIKRKFFGSNKTASFTSDPFIIFARKL